MLKPMAVAALCATLTAGTAFAETRDLRPTMSAQDITTQMEVEQGHVLVPILAMVFMILAMAGSGGNGGGVIITDPGAF
jgi:hypothetical protein